MHWQLWAALLLLAWQNAPSQVQAARTTNLILRQDWQPQAQTQRKSGGQIVYPSYKYVQSRFPGDGYNRRRRLPGQGKAAQTTTTERPFVRYWNNFVRSVQPNFGLRNLTNPLVNLFNNGNANVIETSPVQVAVYNDEEQELPQQAPVAATQSANKRKRKRRKQLKRKPIVGSQEQDDTYDYYGTMLPMSLPQNQPLYYYAPNDYYGMRRLHHYDDYVPPANYYDAYFEDTAQREDEPQYTAEDNLRKLGTKKYTVLRPLSLAIELPSGESSLQTAHDDTDDDTETNEIVSNAAIEDADKSKSDESASDEDRVSTSELSESMRNALGAYMRDDIRNRQRQRQSERQREVGEPAKTKPRQHYFFAARLVKNHQ